MPHFLVELVQLRRAAREYSRAHGEQPSRGKIDPADDAPEDSSTPDSAPEATSTKD